MSFLSFFPPRSLQFPSPLASRFLSLSLPSPPLSRCVMSYNMLTDVAVRFLVSLFSTCAYISLQYDNDMEDGILAEIDDFNEDLLESDILDQIENGAFSSYFFILLGSLTDSILCRQSHILPLFGAAHPYQFSARECAILFPVQPVPSHYAVPDPHQDHAPCTFIV